MAVQNFGHLCLGALYIGNINLSIVGSYKKLKKLKISIINIIFAISYVKFCKYNFIL